MTTALDIIKRSLRLATVLGSGETLSAEDSQDGLTALNSMVESISNGRLLIHTLTLDSFALTSGDGEYSIGATGDIASTRPINVDESSYILKGTISYPLRLIDASDYNAIGDKAADGDIPEYLWYRASYPNATLTFYPVPGAGCTLKLWSWKALSTFADLTTTVSLPPGYEEMLAFNLAANIGPEYGVDVPMWVIKQASVTKKRIKRTNTVVPTSSLPIDVLGPYRTGHIESDT